jgi:hypothetical protein
MHHLLFALCPPAGFARFSLVAQISIRPLLLFAVSGNRNYQLTPQIDLTMHAYRSIPYYT